MNGTFVSRRRVEQLVMLAALACLSIITLYPYRGGANNSRAAAASRQLEVTNMAMAMRLSDLQAELRQQQILRGNNLATRGS